MTQLEQTNKIFLEHEKLLLTDSLYKKQEQDYKKIIACSDSIDSLRINQLDLCSQQVENLSGEINQLSKKHNKLNKLVKIQSWIIAGLTTGIISLLIAL